MRTQWKKLLWAICIAAALLSPGTAMAQYYKLSGPPEFVLQINGVVNLLPGESKTVDGDIFTPSGH